MEEGTLRPDDRIKERIRIELEIARLVGIYFLTAGGGTISLIIDRTNTASENIFIAFGLATSIAAFIFCIRTGKELLKRVS